MGRRKGGDYVTGQPGAYLVKPTIEHPAECVCARCSVIPREERLAKPVTHRMLRQSPHPDSRLKSTLYAWQLKREIEEELRSAVEAAAPPPPEEMSLAQICELYFAMNPRKVSEATIERDRISARNVCRLVSPLVSPDAINEPVAVRYRNAREKEGARPRTILNELSFLRMVLKFGHAWQSDTGMRAMKLASVPDVGSWDSPGVALSVDEFASLLEVASDRDRGLLVTGVTTLLRRRPLLGLRAEWVDRGKRWLSVPPEWQKKGHAKRRYGLEVPVSAWTVDSLPDVAIGLLWPSKDTGEPLTSPTRILMSLSIRAKVRDFSMHDLRTTGATWLQTAGVDELAIAILLGHRSAIDAESGTFSPEGRNVTRGYTKVIESTLREAVAVFDETRKQIARKASGLRLA